MSQDIKLKVIDSSATAECPVREHHIFVGGQLEAVKFRYGQATELPYAIAMKFNQDGFRVMNLDDTPFNVPAKTSDVVRFQIGENEIVATYDELTDDAIKLRALVKFGGEYFAAQEVFNRKEAIEFLKQVVKDEDKQKEDAEFGSEPNLDNFQSPPQITDDVIDDVDVTDHKGPVSDVYVPAETTAENVAGPVIVQDAGEISSEQPALEKGPLDVTDPEDEIVVQ